MEFIEYCTKSEKQWLYGHRIIANVLLTHVIVLLPGSCSSLPLPTTAGADHNMCWEKIKIQNSRYVSIKCI